jgi:L-lactate utilization protein LutB
METPIQYYWQVRLAGVKEVLEGNNFEVFLAASSAEAKAIVSHKILPECDAKSISWGGSQTFMATGLYEDLVKFRHLKVVDVFDKTVSAQEKSELRRRALLVDVFITGTNAVTETGCLVNLDMYGNRIAALTFGPRYVIVLVGRNKITTDLDEAMNRVKNYAAPINAMRLDKKTPCVKTSYCEECKSPDRICNSWAITEKSFPKGRIKVILINADLGF